MNKFVSSVVIWLSFLSSPKMVERILKPHGIRTSYLNVSDTMDPLWESSTHNPANFNVEVPNSVRTHKIWKISPSLVTVPRMFPNIYAPDNVMIWYQRRVLELPTTTPDVYLRTVSPVWEVTNMVTFEPRLWNTDQIVAKINAATGGGEVWSFDAANTGFVVTKTAPGAPIAFGLFTDHAHVPPALSYANMTYIAEGSGGHIFTILGLEKLASVASNLPLSPAFVDTDPSTFDNILNSNLSGRNLFPLFDRTAHDYTYWATTNFTSSVGNPPNLAGPAVVHVSISDLGDSSTVDAKTGIVQDIITSVTMGNADFGTFVKKEIHDLEGECIEYQQARNISRFNVTLLDTRRNVLTLPRNFPVFLRLQLVHVVD